MANHTLETYTGLTFDYDRPTPEQVSIVDIAHALSLTGRFAGHIDRYYSVAEHALLVSHLILVHRRATNHRMALAGLHHDDHEAYLGDVPTPLKNVMGEGYRVLVARADGAIAKAVGVPPDDFHAEDVRWADAVALRIEADVLKSSKGDVAVNPAWYEAWVKFNLFEAPRHLAPPNWEPGLTPAEAEQGFLAQHEFLSVPTSRSLRPRATTLRR